MLKRRVVVTGIGIISPIGTGKEAFWEALSSGKNGIGRISAFDASSFSSQIAAEVKDFNAAKYLDKKEAKKLVRFIQFAIAAGQLVAADANLKITQENAPTIGVLIGSGIGGIGFLTEQAYILKEKGPSRVSPFAVPFMIPDMAAGYTSINLGAKGPNSCTTTACASGTHAIGDAFKIIQRGDAEAMICGGTEAAITPLAIAAFCSARALSNQKSRPFDKQRDGFVMGEGCGLLMLEELEHAKARQAHIYAEIVGYGMSGDANHITAPAPRGEGAVRAIRAALKDASLSPQQIDYVNAHGTSTELNDKFETMALKTVFGEHAKKIAISSNKSMFGHLLGAAGGVEAVATVLTIGNDLVPPTINYETPDPDCDLDYTPNHARKMKVNTAISNSFGFGGHNAIIVLKKYS